MYLDIYTQIAVIIAIVAPLMMSTVLFFSARKWEQAYWDVRRLLIIEKDKR